MEKDLTTGSIGWNLFHLAWPLMLGMLFQAAFNIVDTVFVGMLGAAELAAISVTFPVVIVFISIASGLAIGANALVAQAIGARDYKKADNIAEHSLLFSLFVGITVAVLGIIFSPGLFSFMGATPQILPLTRMYADIIFVGFIFLFVGFIAMNLIRAQGNTKTPMKFQISAVLLNIVLDPILIFGLFGFPALGLMGAAFATIFSRIIMALGSLLYLFLDRTKIRLRPRDFSPNLSILKRIITVGFPASVSQSINSIGMILLMSLVGAFGPMAIAAYGIGMRLETLVLLPAIGLSSAVITMVGQNYGGQKFKRAKKTVKFGATFTLLIGLVFAVLMYLFPGSFFQVFTQEQAIVSIGVTYLSIVAFSYVFRSVSFSLIAGFRGTGKTYISMLLILSNWLIAVALGWWLMQSMGLTGIWFGLLYASIITTILCLAVFKSEKWL